MTITPSLTHRVTETIVPTLTLSLCANVLQSATLSIATVSVQIRAVATDISLLLIFSEQLLTFILPKLLSFYISSIYQNLIIITFKIFFTKSLYYNHKQINNQLISFKKIFFITTYSNKASIKYQIKTFHPILQHFTKKTFPPKTKKSIINTAYLTYSEQRRQATRTQNLTNKTHYISHNATSIPL